MFPGSHRWNLYSDVHQGLQRSKLWKAPFLRLLCFFFAPFLFVEPAANVLLGQVDTSIQSWSHTAFRTPSSSTTLASAWWLPQFSTASCKCGLEGAEGGGLAHAMWTNSTTLSG